MTRFKKNMRRFVVAAVVGAMAMSMTACTSHMFDEKTITGTIKDNADDYTKVQKEFEEYLHDEYVDSVTSDTLSYNYEIKDGDALGIPEPEVSLGDSDMSDEGIKKSKAEFDESFDKLKSFDRDDLTESQQLTYDILNQYLETESEGYLNIYLSEPFSPMKGLQSNISTYFTDYRFDDKGDVERYLQVLGMVRDYFDDYLEFEKTKSEKGYFMSDAVCDKVIEQCEDFIKDKDNHFMIQVFNDNIEALDFLTADEIADFEEQNKKAVAESLIPAYEDVIDVLSSLKGTGKNQGGVCGYEGGKEYYAYLLKDAAGTDKTPEEVAQMLDDNLSDLMTDLYSIAMTQYDSYEYFVEHYDDLFGDSDSKEPSEIIDILMNTATKNYPDFGEIKYQAKKLDKSLEDIQDNAMYVIGGLISRVTVKLTKNNQNMAYVTIEDLVGQVIVFPRDFEKFRDRLLVDSRVFVRGRANLGEKENKLILSDMISFEEAEGGKSFQSGKPWNNRQKPVQSKSQLWVLFDDVDEYMKNESAFMSILEEYKGTCPVYVQLKKSRQAKNMGRGFCVDENSGVVYALQMEYGKDRVLLRKV